MIRNYIKIAWRNLANNKMYSLINILGLAMGIATCALICLYVIDEAGYDKQYADGERIYRVASEVKGEKWVAAAAPVAGGLKKDYPEVEQVTRLLRMPGVEKILLNNEAARKKFYEINGYYVDSTFFQLFDYSFKYGNRTTALDQPNTIVISADIASKLFGDVNPVDKVIKVTLPFGDNRYTVKGVFASNGKSHIPAHLFLSMNNSDAGQWVKRQNSWASNSVFHTYIKLNKESDPNAFETKLKDFFKRNGAEEFKAAGYTKALFLQPLRDIYLHSNFEFEIAPNGNVRYLYIFGSVAAFLLFIACINFMNLSTARSEKRAKEVGLRKVVGAVKSSLVAQFLGESLFMSLLALIIAFGLIVSLVPVFNEVTGKSIQLNDHLQLLAGLLGLTLLTGLLSGLYPAFYLSSFVPVSVLKGRARNTFSAIMIRKGLVVFQFSISMILILGAMLINRQMNYLSNQNLGFNKNQKLIFPLQSIESSSNVKVLKNELDNDPQIISSTTASTYPGIENVQGMLFYGEGKAATENLEISTANIGSEYLKTLGIQLLKGRSFSDAFRADSNAVVLNETAVNKLGYTVANVVGRKIFYDLEKPGIAMNIIGVVKDYHFEGLQKEIRPLALTNSPFFSSASSYLIVNVKSGNYSKIVGKIGQLWQKINPNTPFEYTFLDQDFQKNYEKEARTSRLISYFAFIGIFIACLGLFGLATFTAEQRSREIGIRKVLGASVFSITKLLSGDFVKLVFISILIASPVAWWAMEKWLADFAFKTDVSWQIFFIAGSLLTLLSLLTIGYQAVSAALLNPVKTLRGD